jgi:SAM-dependent methyltransferase
MFVHPDTKQMLEMDSEGNLFCRTGGRIDDYRCYNGCYDFAIARGIVNPARDAYDEFYARIEPPKLSRTEISQPWSDRTVPWRRTMLKHLGSMSGKRVLVLGGGVSYKEFHFLHLGARVVFTDLSLVAVRRAQTIFRKSELWAKHSEDIEFHAVDGLRLPFPEQSFDVIYGAKFVGFVGDLPGFLLEVSRVLKPGGICRFCDDAYSPVWEVLRRNVMHPLKARQMSPSTLSKVRSSSTFGFREEPLQSFKKSCGFSKFTFEREYFFLRIAQIAWATVFGWNPNGQRFARPLFLAMAWVDHRFANTKWMRSNSLALTWGFDKCGLASVWWTGCEYFEAWGILV